MCVRFADGTIAQVESWVGSAPTRLSTAWRSSTPVRAMSCQTYQICFVDEQGAVRCEGRDSPDHTSPPLFVEPLAASMATALDGTVCVVTTEGRARCEPNRYPVAPHATEDMFNGFGAPLRAIVEGTPCAVTTANELVCRDPSGAPRVHLTHVVQASLAMNGPVPNGGCAVTERGHVTCWGANAFGQVGNGERSQPTPPAEVAGLVDIVTVSYSGTHACALSATHALYCWGSGAGPDGVPAMRALPRCKQRTVTLPPPCTPDPGGPDDPCGRMTWNARRRGEGDTETVTEHDGTCVGPGEAYVARPVRITLVPVPIFVATSGTRTVALGADGLLTTWGRDSDYEQHAIPTVVSAHP